MDEELRPYEEEGDIDLEFTPRKPAVSAMRRKQASRQEKAEQGEDDRKEGGLWKMS
jgi:hypothetical protein